MAEPAYADIHQHVWTAPLVEALTARRWLPFVRTAYGVTVLHSAGERPYVIDRELESPRRRAGLVQADRLDLAVVALSSPIGIECLPRSEAQPLIAAHLQGVSDLGAEFAAWGPLALDQPDPDDVDALLDRGCIGISLPAYALAGASELDSIGPVLARAAEHQVPVFIHPGPPVALGSGEPALEEPLWWRALTDYVSQMQSAWLTFVTQGRRRFPELRAVFAMLAGGAPLLSERLEARGGPPVDVRDPLTFYETSSYGPAAVESMARRVGPDQLVYGSDRPVIAPAPTGREAILQRNAARLIGAAVRRPTVSERAWATA